MSHLKKENLNKCFSLLREFVEESAAVDNKKGIAVLALNQLQKVIAGGESAGVQITAFCVGKPIANQS
ncbi:MAG: hypothetical protein L0Y73_01055 [Candidatus Aminicenantes bacterium]|nr:hypothetical protein [Candidatus Aminicenantes bacterium]